MSAAHSAIGDGTRPNRIGEWAAYRLPRTVVPRRYDLTLAPDLASGTFTGSATIALDVREPVSEIVLNAAELALQRAELAGPGGARCAVEELSFDPSAERVAIGFAAEIAPGAYALTLTFGGALNDRLFGFYRSRFTDAQGNEHTIAATQLQATNARRVFPCFDEPSFKAIFRVTLIVPAGLDCVSNAEVAEERVLDGGARAVRFHDSMRMSPYLVAFALGPFEATAPLDVDGVALRTVCRRGKGHLTGFALSAAAFALRYFAATFDIPYPAGKLDQVAIPDFAAAGMENAGCVMYREAVLLVDPQTASRADVVRSADVIAHEIAHTWFGDLVTMEWWNGLWLNEAFATFMSIGCVDAYLPESDRWTRFSLDRSKAFELDALECTRTLEYRVESPLQALGMLDVLTYQKGASLLRTLEQFLGTEAFFGGVGRYLNQHAWGNATGEDLWDALERATGRPVARIMRSWIHQKGYPILTLALGEDRKRLTIAQERFCFARSGPADETLFSVPLILRSYSAGRMTCHRVLLEEATAVIEFPEPVDAVVMNAGGYGFYRVRYEPAMLRALLARRDDRLSPIERYTLVDDCWAAVVEGSFSAAEFLETVPDAGETDANVWALLSECFDSLDRVLEGQARAAYRARLRRFLVPALDRLGWDAQDGETAQARQLRGSLLRVAGTTAADAHALAHARTVHARSSEDPRSTEPNLAAAAAAVVAAHGDDGDYGRFLDEFRRASTPQAELLRLRSLAAFPRASHMERTLAMCLSGEVRSQDAPLLLADSLRNRDHGSLAWRFVKEHWEYVNRTYSPVAIAPLLAGVTSLTRPEEVADVAAFFAEHEVPQSALMIRQHTERQHVNAALRARESQRLARSLLEPELATR